MAVSILELKEMVKRLPDLTDIIRYTNNNIIEYDGDGIIFGKNLYNSGLVAIQQATMLEESQIKIHQHEEIEIIIVIFGQLEFNIINKGCIMLNTGDVVKILPNELHTCKALKNTELIGITIPASKGYPHG